jgi:pimeloyl-ACP methyl ester carboxylesterase
MKYFCFLSLTLAFIAIGVQTRAVQHFIDTKLDQVNPNGGDSTTFKMRYLVDDSYWKNAKHNESKPILFYAGNEGDIWGFYKNSGFMT